MTSFTDLASVPGNSPEPFDDRLRLAVAAYLARFKGSSFEHTASDLRCYLAWCVTRGLDPLGAKRPHLELYIRWMHEVPHRPARPRASHGAPARSLAPRTRMDDPVHRHLRPTPHTGLTSPDPVSTRVAGAARRPSHPTRNHDRPRNSKRRDSHALTAGNNTKRHQQKHTISAG